MKDNFNKHAMYTILKHAKMSPENKDGTLMNEMI